jgi:hypothetical protein
MPTKLHVDRDAPGASDVTSSSCTVIHNLRVVVDARGSTARPNGFGGLPIAAAAVR